MTVTTGEPLLEAKDLQVTFRTRRQRGKGVHLVHAVDHVSLTVRKGEILALVGESGSGKSTLGQALVGLLKPDQGQVLFAGSDVYAQHGKASRALHRQMQVVFQESRGSLNARMRVEDVIGEGLAIQRMGDRAERRRQVAQIARQVGLGGMDLSRYPHQFSGGQRQRIGIARALAVQPEFLVADEPVAALDVSVRAQVLNLLLDLRTDLGLTYVLISHDLAVIERVSDRIAVMYMGRIMETGSVADVYAQPQMPYTYALLSARPAMPGKQEYRRVILPGDVGRLDAGRKGCPFAPRCWMATEVCRQEQPELRETRGGHWAACHFAGAVEAPASGSAASGFKK